MIPTIEIFLDIVTPKISADTITTKGTEIILIRLTTAVKEIDKAINKKFRDLRIANGLTYKTKVVKSKKKYVRRKKDYENEI